MMIPPTNWTDLTSTEPSSKHVIDVILTTKKERQNTDFRSDFVNFEPDDRLIYR